MGIQYAWLAYVCVCRRYWLLTMRDICCVRFCAVPCCACTNQHRFFPFSATVTRLQLLVSPLLKSLLLLLLSLCATDSKASLWFYFFSTEAIGSFDELERAIIFKMLLEWKNFINFEFIKTRFKCCQSKFISNNGALEYVRSLAR